MDNLPYQPVVRDRQTERGRASQIPDYTEAREDPPRYLVGLAKLMKRKSPWKGKAL